MRLPNGNSIPAFGFGSAAREGLQEDKIFDALQVGYRLIDTAWVYKTETLVGNAVRRAGGVKREELFIQTKFYPQMPYDYKVLLAQFQESLQALQLEYVDAYLIHQPVPRYSELEYKRRNADIWKAMEQLYEEGKARAIGVSNFLERHILQIEETCTIPPMINQLEINPMFQQRGLAEWCMDHGMIVQSWGPMGTKGAALKMSSVLKIAEKHKVSPARVCLRWNVQRGHIPISASQTVERIEDNYRLDFALDEEDMELIRSENTSTEHRETWWYPRQQMY